MRRVPLLPLIVRIAGVCTLLLAGRGRAAENDYLNLILPSVGDHTLHVLSPTLLELKRLNGKLATAASVDSWDLVDSSGVFHAPALSDLVVKVNGAQVAVTRIGFKRRPFYAPLLERDLRIDNSLFLEIATPIPADATVTVTNPNASLWEPTDTYTATASALRFNPAIHVNQEGYVPGLPKKAMVGYYLGDLGEMEVPASLGFKVVTAGMGVTVYEGTLTSRPDVGYLSTPTPYQNVLEADFSSVVAPGRYQIVVPTLGASVPFLIDEGIAMGFLRTYALGLYHQRCGAANELPFTRFIHDACHLAAAEVPATQADYAFTWTTIAAKTADYAANPRHTAPRLMSPATQLYPFVNAGPIDVSGGHHDAGDYSKYTINVAALIHLLMFNVDAIPGVAALDNLGVPESGDGVSDVMQEAKREADYLAKLQDADGGFYFLVYPKTREYESNVLPDHGDTQVVWPKNTAATAAAVAALAQCASSPLFKSTYPAEAAAYLAKAQLGWQFLLNAIAAHGKDGAYQKLTHYGDPYMHDDELAWAAAELFVATGDAAYQTKLLEWFPDPSDPATFRFGWQRMSESWGNAIRAYAFAVRTGRLLANQLNADYLVACETQIKAAGDDALRWSDQNAYASSFPEETKRFLSAGWYFSLDQAADMAVAYQLDAKPEYIDALVGNMNYEGGSNPVNVTYVTGLGQKRQREIVHQYAQNDRRVLPPSGLPIGNIQTTFDFFDPYGAELAQLTYPSDGAVTAPYEFYDRWADAFNVTTEAISANQARAMISLGVLATRTTATATPWTSTSALAIGLPTLVMPLEQPLTLSLVAPDLNLDGARIVWEARDQEPAFGPTYTFSPLNNGVQWTEVEIEWPDGRRAFASGTFQANAPVVNWVRAAVPRGSIHTAGGGDAWTWVASPTPSGNLGHLSAAASGIHFHGFANTRAPLVVNTGDIMFARVYLDPLNPPREVMLTWNDGSAEHRAYWGEDLIPWGDDDTAGRRKVGDLPPLDRWVRLEVPAAAVGLEGSTAKSMDFVLYDGRATWDYAGLSAAGTIAANITTHPQSQVTTVGSDIGFTVIAIGAPAPTYQWKKNGVNIPGATGATLNLPAVQLTDAASYSVVVTNPVQSVTSNVATLTVNPTVAITTQPASQAIVLGASANFVVVADGTAPFTYQWRKDGGPIPGATASTLTLPTVALTDAGSYDVVVSDATTTTTSGGAVLTVLSAPVIAEQPTSATANPGQAIFFTVTASANPAPTYAWRKNGAAITGNPSATTAALSLENVTAADAGTYSVVITNSVGAVTSANAILAVNTAPAITAQPLSRTVVIGANVTLSVTAVGDPAPTYQWLRDGDPIVGATGAMLALTNVQATASGEYRVAVTNAAGTITSGIATLLVVPPVAIATPPASVTRNVGQSATFSVVVTGTAPITYQWRKDGAPIAGGTAASFTLASVAASDAGNYDVVVTDVSGVITSTAATLTVEFAPTITTQPVARTVMAGANASFSVVTTGVPAPTYQWKKNGTDISGANAATLTLTSVGAGDAGSYTVVVTNSRGTVTSTAALLVVDFPRAITAQPASLTALAGSPVTLSVTAVGTGPLTYQWRKGGGVIVGATDASFTLASAALADAGSYDVIVTDAAGITTSTAAILTVNAAPTITAQPNATTVNVGQTATLSVGVTGNPAPAFQWRKGGVAISGNASATTATLSLPNVTVIDAGNYDVVVTNSIGAVTSDLVVVTVAQPPPPPPPPPSAASPPPSGGGGGGGGGGTNPFPTLTSSLTTTAAANEPFTFTLKSASPTATFALNNPPAGFTVDPATGVISGTFKETGTQVLQVSATNAFGSATNVLIVTVGARPVFTSQPGSRTASIGEFVNLRGEVTASPYPSFQWRKDGVDIPNATSPVLLLASFAAADAGVYTLVASNSAGSTESLPALLSPAAAGKVAGAAHEVGSNIVHPNGNVYDQVLLEGASATVTADPGQVLRISYIDLNDDIVQVEFAGAGSLSIILAGASGPAAPVKYNQAVNYMKGHATLAITGANETTNVSVFSVGRANAVNQALFRSDIAYDGFADIALITIASANGKFGGVRTSNASYFATSGFTGLYAPGVQFTGPVFVGDLQASDAAQPVLLLGAATDVRITGGDLLQANGHAVAVSGIEKLKFTDGTTSQGTLLPATQNRARLEQNGADVTARLTGP